MAKPKCEIKFDNNLNRIYYGGQTIVGNAIITLDGDTKVNGIHITFNGRGECKWTSGAGKNKKTYTSEEYYLSTRINFVGFDNSSEIIVPRGVHTYHFSCTLPESLPSSFDGKFGYIKYFAIVIFDVPMEPNKSFELGFTIVKTMNLNHNIELKNPVAIEKNVKFLKCCCCICCLSDSLIVKARIPIGGYIAGQIIPIKLDVINKSNQKVNRLKIGLYKIMKFTCGGGSDKTRKDIKKLIDGETEGCKSGARKEFQHDLLVPSVIPTDATSNICDISYSIKVTGEVGCFHRNPVLFIPITIGTVSIIGSVSHNDNGMPAADSNVVITTTIKPSRDTTNPPEIHLEPPAYDDVVINRPTNSNNNSPRVGGRTTSNVSATQTSIEEYYKS